MNLQDIDRTKLKSVVAEILLENPEYIKEILVEILEENNMITSDDVQKKKAKLEQLIKEDFDKYEVVFKSLA